MVSIREKVFLVCGGDFLQRQRALDPRRSGRMPVILGAAERVIEAVAGEVPVLVSLKGPFSAAALATGLEGILFDAIETQVTIKGQMEVAKLQELAMMLMGMGGAPSGGATSGSGGGRAPAGGMPGGAPAIPGLP